MNGLDAEDIVIFERALAKRHGITGHVELIAVKPVQGGGHMGATMRFVATYRHSSVKEGERLLAIIKAAPGGTLTMEDQRQFMLKVACNATYSK